MTNSQQLSQPNALYVLFFTEMWERFSYYGMRALLVLYLVSQFKFERADALEIYAIFTGLVYITPIIGGLLADKILGQQKAIFIGGLLMAFGQFALAAGESSFYIGLGLICVGNGFFKPNISTIVGTLYQENDPRRDGGFTIFYMGINIGAFLAPLICGYLGEQVSWSYGFAAAGVGMLLGTAILYFFGKILGKSGLPPNTQHNKLVFKDLIDVLVYVVVCVSLVLGAVFFWTNISQSIRDVIKYIGFGGGALALVYTVATNTKGADEWGRMVVIFFLLFFNVFFWAGFEQAGGTFNLFAAQNTDRSFFGAEIPASYFQAINSIFIFTIAPLFSIMWQYLNAKNLEPSTPYKFAYALALLGVGFVVMHLASQQAESGLVSPLWLVMVYFFHTLGELCLSPVGLSMITKLAPQRIVSVMMGLWFGSIASAQYVAGILESLLHQFEAPLFLFLIATSFTASACLFLLAGWLKKMMRGVL